MMADPGLSKDEVYLQLEQLMSKKDKLPTKSRLSTVVDLLHNDLLRGDNNPRILKIFNLIFSNGQAESYMNSRVDVIMAILDKLLEALKDPSGDGSNLGTISDCFDILDNIPTSHCPIFLKDARVQICELLTIYLTKTDLPHRNQAFQFLKKCLSRVDTQFVKDNLNIWLSTMVSFIFKPKNPYRKFGLDIADLVLPELAKMKYFDHPQWPVFLNSVKNADIYPKVLHNLMTSKDPAWSRVWILLIKMMQTGLHHLGYAINPLLFVLQESFKTAEFQTETFHCMRVLIDNFALDPQVLFNKGRVKVIMCALSVNNTKTGSSAAVKLELWWHFIRLLLPKIHIYSEIVLIPFTKFCFGEERSGVGGKPKRFYPGETFLSLQSRIVKMFGEICGHVDGCNCIRSGDLKLNQPILNRLFESSRPTFIYSLKCATTYCHKLIADEFDRDMVGNRLKCIWVSFLKYISSLNHDLSRSMLEDTLKMVLSLVEVNCDDSLFVGILIRAILPSLMDKNNGFAHGNLNNAFNSCSFVKTLIPTMTKSQLYSKNSLEDVQMLFDRVIKIGLINGAKDFCLWAYKTIPSDKYGSLFRCRVIHLIADLKMKIDNETFKKITETLFTEHYNKEHIFVACSEWKNLYRSQKSLLSKEEIMEFFKMVSIIFKSSVNNGNFTAIVLLPNLIEKSFHISHDNKHTVEKFLDSLKITKVNDLDMTDLKFRTLVDCLVDWKLALKDFFILENSKNTNLLSLLQSVLNSFLKSCSFIFTSTANKDVLSNNLDLNDCSLLNTLDEIYVMCDSDQLLQSIIDLICIIKENYKPLETNYIKVLRKILNNEKNKKLNSDCADKIRGVLKQKSSEQNIQNGGEKCQKSATLIKSPLTPKSIPIKKIKDNDEYVVIKNNWKFDPKNLTDRQRDSIKRRRDDIPALYEDLSQSQDDYSMKSWKASNWDSNGQSNSQSNDSSKTPTNSKSDNSDKLNDIARVDSTKAALAFTPKNDANPIKIKPINRTEHLIKLCLSNEKDKTTKTVGVLGGKATNNKTETVKKCPKSDTKAPMSGYRSLEDFLEDGDVDVSSKQMNGDKNKIEQVTTEKLLESDPHTPVAVSVKENIPENNKLHLVPDKSDSNKEMEQSDKENDSFTVDRIEEDKKQPSDVNVSANSTGEIENVQTKNPSKNGTGRPARMRRRPSKLLESEFVPLKKQGRKTTQSNENSFNNTKENESLNQSDMNNTSEFKTSIDSIVKKRRQSRLLRQLSIDTKEGHPMFTSEVLKNLNTSRQSNNLTKIDLCNKSDNAKESLPICLSSDESDKLSLTESQSFGISPDFIESSQEDTLSVKANMLISMEKSSSSPKVVSSIDSENVTCTPKINRVEMTSQEIAEADTVPFIDLDDEDPKDVTDELKQTCRDSGASFISSLHGDDNIKERTLEFLNNTLDISPIKGASLESPPKTKPSQEEDETDTKNITVPTETDSKLYPSPVKTKSPDTDSSKKEVVTPKTAISDVSVATDTSPDLFTAEKGSPAKKVDESATVTPFRTTTPTLGCKRPSIQDRSMMKNFNNRTMQMLSMCMTTDNSPDRPVHDLTNPEPSVEHVESDDGPKPLLEFNKVVPSSSASPMGSILKRKLDSDSLTVSPSSKKKRVGFHFPAVSTTVSVEKYISPPDTRSPQKNSRNRRDSQSSDSKPSRLGAAKCLMNKIEMHLPTCSTATADKVGNDLVIMDSQISDICSLIVDSPRPLSVITNCLLNDSDPIYPNLVDCQDPLAKISSSLSSPLWMDKFLKEIEGKILTIGDLARLTELEVSRLPFKTPKVETVRNTLVNYEKQINENKVCGEDIKKSSPIKVKDLSEFETVTSEDAPVKYLSIHEDKRSEQITPHQETKISDVPDGEVNSMEVDNNDLSIKESKSVSEESLVSFLNNNPTLGLKIIKERYSHDEIYESLSDESLIEYVARKIHSDETFHNKLKSLVCKEKTTDDSERLKILQKKFERMSSEFADMLQDFKKYNEK